MLCNQTNWMYLAGLFCYAGLEYYLGKTQKTKASSLIELMVLVVSAFVLTIKLFQRKKNNE